MAAPSLDFEALLSRDYRPARVTRLIARDAYRKAADDRQKVIKEEPVQDADDSQRETTETSRLILSLVTQTPAFARHLPAEKQQPPEPSLLSAPPLAVKPDDVRSIKPSFHAVELGNWESKINWKGCAAAAAAAETPKPDESKSSPNDPMALLKRPRNPFLDSLRFDKETVCWDGNSKDLLEKARKAPLILELGVAGQSVAKHVFQNTFLSAQRPTPALQSDAYRQRVERDWNGNNSQQQQVNRHSLHADKEHMEAVIAERQKKRAQMAKDKTNRVIEAMGTLALGGGRGRTITSSLMGPGGTERTGRPTRASNSSVAHDSEYVEQLDLINQHTLVRDLSKVLLRQYHRPKLPMAVVRQDLPWQFQIRYSKSAVASGTKENPQSYNSMMMGGAPGTLSKTKLRTENDLSPTEGMLILVEYTEERPPVQLSKGMAFKIVNYYRGDKSRCPVSAGGGDRPAARRKRIVEETTTTTAVVKRLDTSPHCDILDWVGKLPKKTKGAEKETINVLPEGITEILHPKVHGPFIGEVDEGTTLTGLISNLFVAPMIRHEPESTDFLMILTPATGATRAGQRDSMGVVLRDLPTSAFCVGQSIPRTRVYAPNTQGEKNFVGPFVSYQIARALARTQQREGHGLRFDELQDRVLPNLELPGNALRQRLKQVAIYDKNTQIWTSKAIGYEGYPGVEALGKTISPEGVAAFETACAASRRLTDLGIHQLLERGSHTVVSVGVAMVYLAGQLNAAREQARKMKKLVDLSKSSKNIQTLQTTFYEQASQEMENCFKSLRQRYEVAQFIYEELQLAPWHLTGEYIDVHKKGEGTGMMKLTGLGDPSGRGEGFSFIREADSKPSKSVGNAALSAQVKKITGTEDDLRKLTMKQMASLLRSYGMAQKQIDTLKRWDRVHVIRDLSTKAASDGIGDGLERFARGEKMKLSEQKQMYRDRIQVIWRRQLALLATGGRGQSADGGAAAAETEIEEAAPKPAAKKDANDDSDDDSDEDDDDLAAALEDEMMDRTEANQLVAEHARGNEFAGGLGQLRAATQDQDLTKDARELAALKRQREEERAAQEGMKSARAKDDNVAGTLGVGRKIIRKRVTKTHPDGRQTTTFKFILNPEEVGKIQARLLLNPDDGRPRNREMNYEHGLDEKPPGHAMFEDEDDFEYSSKGRLHAGGRRGKRRGRGGRGGRSTPRTLQLGKLKTRVSKEERMRKRKREEEELDVYTTTAKRKGTNNRRERGSIRDRRPHVIYAERLEAIRGAVEARPYAGPFQKPVNRRIIPRYYEVISHPIDLQTIRDRISRYEYRSVDIVLRDFELMKNNAIKFNGQASPIAQEAISIYDFVKDKIESDRAELTALEAAVDDQMGGGGGKQGKSKRAKKGGTNTTNIGGVNVNLGDLRSSSMPLDDADSDSDDSFS